MIPRRSQTGDINRLWDGVRQSNSESLAELYEQLYFHLTNYGIRICGDTGFTGDIINEMFLELWDNRRKLPEVTNVKSYLLTYLRRKMLATMKKFRISDEAASFFSASTDNFELSYEALIVAVQTTEEMKQKVKRAIASLTPRQRELIQLRYFDGLSMEEVSAKAGIAPKTAYNILGMALKSLSAELAFAWLLLLLA